jgi:hypothetical protein
MSCICKKNIKSDEKCTHKSKPDSNYCGVHKQCKDEYKKSKKPTSKKPTSKKSASKKSASKKSASKKSASKKSASKKSASKKSASEKSRCSCINSTSGERCKNNAKDDSKFCNVHKKCKNPVKNPKHSATKKTTTQKKKKEEDKEKEEVKEDEEEVKEDEEEDEEKEEKEKIDLDANIPGTSYTWRQFWTVLKSSNKDDNIEAQWTNIKNKNMVLTLMRECLLQTGESDDIIKDKNDNIFFFINFLQKFNKDKTIKIKIFNSLYNTFMQNSEKFIENKNKKYLKNPISSDTENIQIHSYLSLVGHFLYFYLTPTQKTIFAHKYINSILKSYDYTVDSFPENKKGFKFIFPDEGKLAIYQTLIVLYDVFFGDFDKSK